MDNRNRLTKWEEWKVGDHYEWVKGNMVLGDYVLVEINQTEGFVRLQIVGSPNAVRHHGWQRRYRHKS